MSASHRTTGYLTSDGRVVRDARHPDRVGAVHRYDEFGGITRTESHYFVVALDAGGRFSSDLRRDAIAKAFDARTETT